MSEACKGINWFTKGHQPRTDLEKAETDDLIADSHNILNRWKTFFSQLFNVPVVNDVRQAEMQYSWATNNCT
jgi:hypothetical protein